MSLACYCSSPECRILGCSIVRDTKARALRHGPFSGFYGDTGPKEVGSCFGPEIGRQISVGLDKTVEFHPPGPVGCVCPPGSEQTCQRSNCGRRDGNTGRAEYRGSK